MFDDTKVTQMGRVFSRIFTLPINRSTFREMQSALLAFSEGKQDIYQAVFESLLTGKVSEAMGKHVKGKLFEAFIQQFNVKAWVAKEVHDKGDFVNFVTSDLLTQPNKVIFSNCIRTVDGKELRFLTDIESTLQLLNHFIGRIHEAEKVEASKEAIEKYKSELVTLKGKLEDLI